MPVYEQSGLLCYIDSAKEHVRFGFYRGAELPNSDRLLEGNSKTGGHIKLRALNNIQRSSLTNLVKAIIFLNNS